MDVSELYLDLMVKTLCRFDGVDNFQPVRLARASGPIKKTIGSAIQKLVEGRGLEIVWRRRFDAEVRRNGRDWPMYADTMIGVKRLENIRALVKTVVSEDIEGDLVETGVWRGGGSIMMRAALAAYGDEERTVWCADSFQGLPAPDMSRYPQDVGMIWHTNTELAVSQEDVERNFAKYGFLDSRTRFLKGWFKDTLPTAPIDKIAILRLDGDLYASTMDALNPLYDKISVGGFVIVDDYGIAEDVCRRAIHDFHKQRGISPTIHDIDGYGVYWRKE